MIDSPPRAAGLEGLLERLRRRKVGQWGIVYAAGAWGFLQGLQYVTGTFHWPAQVQQVVTLALLVGLPIVLVIAWYHGDRGQQRVSAAELVIITLLFLVGGGIFWRYDRAGNVETPPVAVAGPVAPSIAAFPAVADKSIAVLPFVNMSGDPNNEYFSDGISEEILNVLAREPELSVAARTSSFQFKGEKRDVAEIAAELKVRMVLEGSVRKQADRVRITAQLIDAKSGFHLWSQTYDRDLKDIFAIQDEIARAIGDELKVRMAGTGGNGTSVSGTRNPQAHDLYLRGLAQWQTRREDELFAAKAAFEQAIEADPGFAAAWGGLALSHAVLPDYTTRISFAESNARGNEVALRALSIDPLLPEAYAALGSMETNQGRYETGVALLKRAIALRPSFATAHQWLGRNLALSGKLEEAIASLERASALDPRSLVVAENHATMLSLAGRTADAIAVCAPTLEYAPDSVLCTATIATAYLLDRKPDEARPFLDRLAKSWGGGTERQVAALFEALEGKGDPHAFAVKLAATPDRSWDDPASGNLLAPGDIAPVLMLLDEKELALRYIDAQNTSDVAWSILAPMFDPIRCDSRFQATIKRIKVKDTRAATVCRKA